MPHISRFVSAVASVADEGNDDYYYSVNNECTFPTSAIVIIINIILTSKRKFVLALSTVSMKISVPRT